MSEETEIIKRDVSSGAIELLGSLFWHDSVLHEIKFIRTDSADQVVLILDLLEDWEKQISRRAEITFQRCFLVQSQMSWGTRCMSEGEMIFGTTCVASSDLIEKVRSDWVGINLDTSGLAEFKLELASTGSTLEIVFGSVAIRYLSGSSPHHAPPPLPLKDS